MWKSMCGKKTYPSIELRFCGYYNPHVPRSHCQSNLTLFRVNLKWRCFQTIRRALEPKSVQTMTLTLGDGFSFILFQGCQLENKNQDGLYYCG